MPLLDQSLVVNQTGHLAYHEGEAKRLLDEARNLRRDYDCVADGATDDTAGAQAALDAASAAGGGTVFAPIGVYILDGLRARSGVRLVLDPGAVFKLKNGATNNAVIRRPAAGDLIGFSMEGGTVDGNASNQSGFKDGIAIDVVTGSINRLSLRNIMVQNCYRHGIFVAENLPSDGFKEIVGCEVNGHGLGAIGFGIYADYAGVLEIVRNTVRGAGNNSDAIELGNTGKYICTHNLIVDSQLQFPSASDSLIAFNILIGTRSVIQNDTNTAHRVRIIGNSIIGATPDAAAFAGISATGDDIIVMGNEVSVTTFRGIHTLGARPIIKGNRVVTTTGTAVGAGIYPENGRAARVIGNMIAGGWKQGINVDHSDVTVADNYVEADAGSGTCILVISSADSGRTYTNVKVLDNTLLLGATLLDKTNQTDPSNRFRGNAPLGEEVRVIATGSLPAGSAAMDGLVLVEDAGAGDRNLIIYGGGQRFRIDGGTAF